MQLLSVFIVEVDQLITTAVAKIELPLDRAILYCPNTIQHAEESKYGRSHCDFDDMLHVLPIRAREIIEPGRQTNKTFSGLSPGRSRQRASVSLTAAS